MHIMNGNIEYHDLNVIQINTGNGKWTHNDDMLKVSIMNHSPNIISISESNMNIHDMDMIRRHRNKFLNYLFFDKVFVGTSNARITVLVKDTIEVKRLVNMENNINPSIVLKVNTSSRKHHMIIINYCQWKGTSPG